MVMFTKKRVKINILKENINSLNNNNKIEGSYQFVCLSNKTSRFELAT